jgi:hypothetical protein
MQYDILRACGKNIAVLLAEMQGESELFASANTPQRVEANPWAIAQALAPATLELFAALRRQEPTWFEIGH